MRPFMRAIAWSAALAFTTGAALGQAPEKKPLDPAAILAASKEATGGKAWDPFLTQHSLVAILAGGHTGEVERWSEMKSGRSVLRFALGPMSGMLGFDGTAAWSQEASGKIRVASDEIEAQLAVNAAYRDQLAFWFPTRRDATLSYKGRTSADGADFDIVSIVPKGGREFDLWVNAQTNFVERLVEREAIATRTEYYMDWHDVQGVKIPFRVRASRGDPKVDEILVVEAIEFDGPHAGISFARPGSP